MLTAQQIAGTQTVAEAFAAIYRDPALMRAWIQAAPAPGARYLRACSLAKTTRDPGGRFGVDRVPAAVRAIVDEELSACAAEVSVVLDQIGVVR